MIERKVPSPVLPLHLFKNWVVTNSNLVGFLMNAGMMGAMMYLPFFVQGVKGMSPTQSGFINMPMSIMMVILSGIVGRWMSKSGKYKNYAIFGIVFMLGGMLMMAFMNSIPMAIASMCVFGVGLGLGMPVFTLAAQNAVSPSQLGVVTATSTLFRNIGGTIGISIFGSIMGTTLKKKLTGAVASGDSVDFSQLTAEQSAQLMPHLDPQLLLNQPKLAEVEQAMPADLKNTFGQMMDMLRSVLGDTLSVVFLSGAALLTLALLLVFFMREIPLRSATKSETSVKGPGVKSTNQTQEA